MSELDRLLTNEPVLPTRLDKTLATFHPLDEHEQAYIAGRRGSMPDDHLAESIRQYRAITRADRQASRHPSESQPHTEAASELDRLLANEPALPQPFAPLHRAEGEPPVAHLSQEGAPYQPFYGHMPAEAQTPGLESPPSTRFPEGPSDTTLGTMGHALGHVGNKAIDLYKGMLGSIVDPEIAMQPPLAAGLARLRRPKLSSTLKPELDRLVDPEVTATSASQPETVRVYRGQGTPKQPPPDWVMQGLKDSGSLDAQGRWWTTDKTIADWYAKDAGEGGHIVSQEIPKSVAEAAKVAGKPEARFSRDPHNELFLPPQYGSGGGRTGPPARIELPEPPERLGPDNTWRYEPWRQNYDVHVYDWKDPTVTMWEKFKRRLPADYSIATKHPESPVIGDLDRLSTNLMNKTDDLVHERIPNASLKELSTMDRNLWVTEEAKAYAMWDQSRRAQTTPQIAPQPDQVGMQIVGQSPAASTEDILKALDPRVAKWMRLFAERRPLEQTARAELGLPQLDDVPYPYVPRMLQEDWDRIMMLQRGDKSNALAAMSTTVKGFQQSRTFPTMSEGLSKGMMYEDPQRAIIMRLMLSYQLEETANLMKHLKGRVIFPTAADAKGELLRRRDLGRGVEDTIADPTHTRDLITPGFPGPSTMPKSRLVLPVEDPVAVRGLPGQADRTWYVPSKAEALSLYQHLSGHQASGFGEWSAAMNQLFRNPNLFNPAPHVIKNMGYKYIIASVGLGRNPLLAMSDLAGYSARIPFDFFNTKSPALLDSVSKLSRDATMYMYRTDPALVGRYEAVMPFSRTSQTAYENLKPFLERSKPWATAQVIGKYLTGNSWSSKYIFSQADPAMKFSLWKQYVEKGMSDVAAANQVNVDLIRYTLTSDLTDTWKNVPLNFFVPWRYGTLMATAKQLSTQPWETLAKQAAIQIPRWAMTRVYKTSLLIGAIALGREAYYRETGKTFHLPIDYINAPLAQAVTNPATIPYTAASMYLMGPGADPIRLAGNLKDMFGVLKGTEDTSKIMEMYWGIAQLYGSGAEFVRFAQSVDQHGFGGADYGALAHVVMGAATAEYSNYSPHVKHLEHYIGDDLLPWNPAVKRNISDNEARAAAAELRKPARDLRRDALREQQERRVRP
jgi:hypothetical protein